MEVPAFTVASFVPQQVGGVRVSTPSQAQASDNAVQRNQLQQQGVAAEAKGRSEEARQTAQQQKTEEKRSTETVGSETPASVGRIRFELEEGTHIAKFFDTKDVLIYQVPPEGKIFLVRAQEATGQDQIETSA